MSKDKKVMTKKDVTTTYPEIKNPTQDQTERAIFAQKYLDASKQIADVMRHWATKHEKDLKGIADTYVVKNRVD